MTHDDLGRAWRDLHPPSPGGKLESEPESVRQTVAILQRAWHDVQTSTGSGKTFATAARRRHTTRRALIIAAGIACAVALGSLLGQRASPPESLPLPALDPNRPRVLLATKDRVEMRAGPVHLVLVRQTNPRRKDETRR